MTTSWLFGLKLFFFSNKNKLTYACSRQRRRTRHVRVSCSVVCNGIDFLFSVSICKTMLTVGRQKVSDYLFRFGCANFCQKSWMQQPKSDISTWFRIKFLFFSSVSFFDLLAVGASVVSLWVEFCSVAYFLYFLNKFPKDILPIYQKHQIMFWISFELHFDTEEPTTVTARVKTEEKNTGKKIHRKKVPTITLSFFLFYLKYDVQKYWLNDASFLNLWLLL